MVQMLRPARNGQNWSIWGDHLGWQNPYEARGAGSAGIA
jgi:hypothetical protein